jgi:hypothetical protein
MVLGGSLSKLFLTAPPSFQDGGFLKKTFCLIIYWLKKGVSQIILKDHFSSNFWAEDFNVIFFSYVNRYNMSKKIHRITWKICGTTECHVAKNQPTDLSFYSKFQYICCKDFNG